MDLHNFHSLILNDYFLLSAGHTSVMKHVTYHIAYILFIQKSNLLEMLIPSDKSTKKALQ